MDLEAYMSRYEGETRLQRLLYIGKSACDGFTAMQAYEMAEAQMKVDRNVIRYSEVFGDGTCCVLLVLFRAVLLVFPSHKRCECRPIFAMFAFCFHVLL